MVVREGEGVGFDPSRNCSPLLHLSQLYWENSPKINLMKFYPKLLPTLQSDLEVGNLSVQQRGKLRGAGRGGYDQSVPVVLNSLLVVGLKSSSSDQLNHQPIAVSWHIFVWHNLKL